MCGDKLLAPSGTVLAQATEVDFSGLSCEEVFQLIETLSELPSNTSLLSAKLNIASIVGAFAQTCGYQYKEVSSIFTPRHNASARLVEEMLLAITGMSSKFQDTVYCVAMDEWNVEAMALSDTILQLSDIFNGFTEGVVVGNRMLHGLAVFRGEVIRFYDNATKHTVTALLQQFCPDEECCVCLDVLCGKHTVVPFACGHIVCTSCSETLLLCPKCRATSLWPGLPQLKFVQVASSCTWNTEDIHGKAGSC